MGARVIALGRNPETFARLTSTYGSSRLTTVTMTNTLDGDTAALSAASPSGYDAFLDLSPPAAAGNTYFPAAFSLLKQGGRVALMGSMGDEVVSVSPMLMVRKNLKICGKFMYTREQASRAVQMAETGVLALGRKAGVETTGSFGLNEIDKAVEKAENDGKWGMQVLLEPGK